MVFIRVFFKTIFSLLVVMAYLAVASMIHIFTRNPELRKKKFSNNAHFFARLFMRILKITLKVKNPIELDTHALLASNHLGFVDILSIASYMPSLFVTSKEMQETPVLGLVTEMGACIFVERRNRSGILNDLAQMIKALQQGFRVIIYPEATSHNGEEILPFKRTLLTAAAHAKVPIVPYVFNIKKVNGGPFSIKWRDHVCYYGEMSFFSSIFRTMQLTSIECEIEFLDPVYTHPDDDRGKNADDIRAKIVERFHPVIK